MVVGFGEGRREGLEPVFDVFGFVCMSCVVCQSHLSSIPKTTTQTFVHTRLASCVSSATTWGRQQ